MKRILLPLVFCILPLSQVFGYNIVDRAKLVDDKMKTLDMLNPYGHDFYLGINAAMTTDITSLIDDAKTITDRDGDGDKDTQDVNLALTPHYNKEQMVRAKVDLGIPLPSFSAFNINFTPDFIFDGGLMTMLTPTSEVTTLSTVIEKLDQIPADVRTAMVSCLPISSLVCPNAESSGDNALDEGDDILACLVEASGCSVTQTQVNQIKEAYNLTTIPYISSIDNTSATLPVLQAYAKIEANVGVRFKYETEDKHLFGHLGVNALGRMDIYKYADSSLLLGGAGDMSINDNKVVNATIDYKLGYRNTNYSVFLSAEELKLAEISSEKTGKPRFGTDPLIRLHAQADYRLSVFKVSPFLGSHARSGYGFGDAYYAGADWGVHVWNDRLGLTIRTMLDKEHVTLGLRAKAWVFQTDLMAKIAVTDQVDGIKVNELYTANIRFFF